jgi:hypothetical protein
MVKLILLLLWNSSVKPREPEKYKLAKANSQYLCAKGHLNTDESLLGVPAMAGLQVCVIGASSSPVNERYTQTHLQ